MTLPQFFLQNAVRHTGQYLSIAALPRLTNRFLFPSKLSLYVIKYLRMRNSPPIHSFLISKIGSRLHCIIIQLIDKRQSCLITLAFIIQGFFY